MLISLLRNNVSSIFCRDGLVRMDSFRLFVLWTVYFSPSAIYRILFVCLF